MYLQVNVIRKTINSLLLKIEERNLLKNSSNSLLIVINYFKIINFYINMNQQTPEQDIEDVISKLLAARS